MCYYRKQGEFCHFWKTEAGKWKEGLVTQTGSVVRNLVYRTKGIRLIKFLYGIRKISTKAVEDPFYASYSICY